MIMKIFSLRDRKNAIAFWGLLLLFSSGLYAATPQYVRVSGITNPTGANGIYVKQSGTTGYDPNWEYWKHESATYYIYARKYGATTEYYWNINVNITNDDNAIFFSDGAHGVEFLTSFPSPHLVNNWVPANGATETADGCKVDEYSGATSPEISITGNSAAIADNSSSATFSNHTKFGSQNYSTGSVTRTYTVSNSGTANLTITSAALSGANSSQFSITQPLSLTVAAGGSTTFTVTFDPSSAGIKTATVTVNNNDSDEGTYDFAIDGYGYTPGNLVVSGITGTYASANTVYIHQGVLNGFEYWKSANNYYIYNDGALWMIDNDQNSSSVLFFSANNSTSPSVLNVTSWTAEVGTGTAVVSAAVATADINLKGNGTTITINDATPSFTDHTKFGSVDISSGSRTRTYTIENTGGASLTSLAVTLGGSDAAEFSKTDPSSTVAAYGSTTFTVTFDPSTAGTKTATVSIASNDPDENPYPFYISGDAFSQNNLSVSGITGTYVAANGTYTYQGISNEFQYWKHISQNYYVYNGVYSNQHWWYIDTDQSSISLSDFLFAKISEDVAPVGLTGWTVGTGAAGSPTIVYASPEMDVKGNATSITDGDGSPSLADYTDFGSTALTGGTVIRTFTIQNTGTGTLSLTGTSPYVGIGGTHSGDFSVTSIPSNSIGAGGSTTFQITFNPSGGGTRSAALSIANDDGDENPYNFSIQGTGVPGVTFTNGANAALNFVQTSALPLQTNWLLGQFSLAGDATGATLNSVVMTLAGTYDSGDLASNPLQLYASNTNNFSGSYAIGSSVADPGSGSNVTFSSLSDGIPSGTRYYWVTADISATATVDDNINGTVDASGDLSISGGTLGASNYGKLNAGTDASLPVGLAYFSARAEGRSVVLNWITESEMDNMGFILERREENAWVQIASYRTHDALKGQGNTSSRTDYAFTDRNVESGKEYSYRLSDVATTGAITAHSPLSIKMDDLPITTEMENAYPNPFNPQTYIAYRLSEDTDVHIAVFDMLGRRVKTLLSGRQLAGSYNVYWNGHTETGSRASSGGYVIRMETGSTIKSQKVMLMK
jgi:hypothetical protein